MPNFLVKTTVPSSWMLLALAALTACASDDAADDATRVEPGSANQQPASPPAGGATTPTGVDPNEDRYAQLSSCDQPLSAAGMPYVDLLFALSDWCPSRREGPVTTSTTSAQLTRDPAGGACMRGSVTDGHVNLVMGLDDSNTHGATPTPPKHNALDADAHGIDGFQFTLDAPPAAGIRLEAVSVVGEGCFPGCELHGDFYVMQDAAPGVLRSFDQAGTYRVRFADFQRAPWEDPTLSLDTTHLGAVFFKVLQGDFDFCLRDLKLLDADGTPVR